MDVVLVQVSPPGPDGRYSLGLANDFVPAAMRRARVVIAEVNDQVPCTTLDQPLDEALMKTTEWLITLTTHLDSRDQPDDTNQQDYCLIADSGLWIRLCHPVRSAHSRRSD